MLYTRFKEDGSKVILEKHQLEKFKEMGYTFEVAPVVKEEVIVDEMEEVTEVTEEVAPVVKETVKKPRKTKKKEEVEEVVEETPTVEAEAEVESSKPDIIL